MTHNPNFGVEGLDTAEIRQDTNKISEDAVKRVQEQQKKAKQAQQEIKKDKDINNRLSGFLAFLLKDIQNEKLINTLYNTFFKVKHPQSNIIYLRKNINTKVIVGIFVPFYIKQAQEYHVIDLYKDILPKEVKTTEELVSYLKKLAKLYHDNIPLDKQLFVMFIAECIAEFLPNNSGKSGVEYKQAIQLEITKYLYGK